MRRVEAGDYSLLFIRQKYNEAVHILIVMNANFKSQEQKKRTEEHLCSSEEYIMAIIPHIHSVINQDYQSKSHFFLMEYRKMGVL
jgi:hypothetical protein